jgi:hypothetical protein
MANAVELATTGYSASATFTPAAASHTAGDVVGVAASFAFTDRNGVVIPAGSQIKINSATMLVAGGTNETSTWRLYLFSATPPSALADDAAFVLASGDRASFLGYFDFAQLIDVGDTLFIEATPAKQLTLTSNTLYAYLVNLTTVTPAAIARTIRLHVTTV